MTTAPWTSAQHELCRQVEERAPAAGYTLARCEDGFDLDRDLTALTRATEVRGSGRGAGRTSDRSLRHEVRFAPDDVYSVTDVDQQTRRGPGRVSRSSRRGRQTGTSVSATYVWRDGRFRRTGGHRVDLAAGRKLVEEVAAGLPLTQRRGTAERVGIAGAVLALVALVVVGVVMALLLLL
ncbi:hypothetical protein [Nocardioides sp. AX2bis]|uniref:hypothetical protein n=1 Tax=Nocardioides sp. AX2bis TaxID=2653157 RepID=UPI0012F3C788|nr:hypothetical protein [Nocardioides sp. AX2bis]VXC33482.1 conserved hypothetical protein [Nocardioides sp. AX2bis]